MRYAQGGGLTAEGRRRREEVRLAAVEKFEQRVPAAEIAAGLRVSERPVQRRRRAWEAGGAPGLESKGQGAGAGSMTASSLDWTGCWTRARRRQAGRTSGGRWPASGTWPPRSSAASGRTISNLIKQCSRPYGGHDIPAAINSPGSRQPAGARSLRRAQNPGETSAHLPAATFDRVCRIADPAALIRRSTRPSPGPSTATCSPPAITSPTWRGLPASAGILGGWDKERMHRDYEPCRGSCDKGPGWAPSGWLARGCR